MEWFSQNWFSVLTIAGLKAKFDEWANAQEIQILGRVQQLDYSYIVFTENGLLKKTIFELIPDRPYGECKSFENYVKSAYPQLFIAT